VPNCDRKLWTDFPIAVDKNGAAASLLVISIPFLPGHHAATSPMDFIPIIDHLVALHKQGMVHGDIRAYNTVLQHTDTDINDSGKPKGQLIDFDYGGPERKILYPQGYFKDLEDGSRESDCIGGTPILAWHDWYALGHLIFFIHEFCRPASREITLEEEILVSRMKDFWLHIKEGPSDTDVDILNEYSYDEMGKLIKCSSNEKDEKKQKHSSDDEHDNHPSEEHVMALKKFLYYTGKHGWTLETKKVDSSMTRNNKQMMTRAGGTGSPLNIRGRIFWQKSNIVRGFHAAT
jgi:hypothetical protein